MCAAHTHKQKQAKKTNSELNYTQKKKKKTQVNRDTNNKLSERWKVTTHQKESVGEHEKESVVRDKEKHFRNRESGKVVT